MSYIYGVFLQISVTGTLGSEPPSKRVQASPVPMDESDEDSG